MKHTLFPKTLGDGLFGEVKGRVALGYFHRGPRADERKQHPALSFCPGEQSMSGDYQKGNSLSGLRHLARRERVIPLQKATEHDVSVDKACTGNDGSRAPLV